MQAWEEPDRLQEMAEDEHTCPFGVGCERNTCNSLKTRPAMQGAHRAGKTPAAIRNKLSHFFRRPRTKKRHKRNRRVRFHATSWAELRLLLDDLLAQHAHA